MNAREELIQHYGLKLAQQALWSPETIKQIAEHALTHCTKPAATTTPPCPHCDGDGIISHGYLRGMECACAALAAQYKKEAQA